MPLFWPLGAQGNHMVQMHTCKQNIQYTYTDAHKIKYVGFKISLIIFIFKFKFYSFWGWLAFGFWRLGFSVLP